MSSHDDYTEYNNAISAGTQPTAEEYRFMAMSQEQRQEHIDRMEWASRRATHDAKEADLQRRVAEATAVSLNGNAWYQQAQRGQLHQRVTVQNGKTTVEDLSRPAIASGINIAAPAALVDTLPVTVGGIQLGPQQAKEMLARGEITAADYQRGVNEALAPYGYSAPSFR